MHRCSLLQDVVHRDFTVNALLLSMDKMVTAQQALRWDAKDVVDYVGGFEDVQNGGILRVAPQRTAKQVLTASPVRSLRAVKYCLRFEDELVPGSGSGQRIDEELRRGIRENGYLLKTVSYSVVQLVFASLIQSSSKSEQRMRRCMVLMEELNLNGILSEMMVEEPSFCRYFLNAMSSLDAPIAAVLAQYGYPTVSTVEDECIPRALKDRRQRQQQLDTEMISCHCNFSAAVGVIDDVLRRLRA